MMDHSGNQIFVLDLIAAATQLAVQAEREDRYILDDDLDSWLEEVRGHYKRMVETRTQLRTAND